MAQNVDSDNFDQYFTNAMQEYGVAVETADVEEVEEIQAVSQDDTPPYTMPLVKQALNGQFSYVKISIPNLMTSIAGIVSTTGLLEAPTEEQFNEIFD